MKNTGRVIGMFFNSVVYKIFTLLMIVSFLVQGVTRDYNYKKDVGRIDTTLASHVKSNEQQFLILNDNVESLKYKVDTLNLSVNGLPSSIKTERKTIYSYPEGETEKTDEMLRMMYQMNELVKKMNREYNIVVTPAENGN
jgi:hypothetical protein